jgi:hypothetical protein
VVNKHKRNLFNDAQAQKPLEESHEPIFALLVVFNDGPTFDSELTLLQLGWQIGVIWLLGSFL